MCMCVLMCHVCIVGEGSNVYYVFFIKAYMPLFSGESLWNEYYIQVVTIISRIFVVVLYCTRNLLFVCSNLCHCQQSFSLS